MIQPRDSWEEQFREERAKIDRRLRLQNGEALPGDLDAFILEEPEEAQRLLAGYHLLAGNGTAAPREDIRVGAIPQTLHSDWRRYSLGLGGLTAQANPLRPGDFMVLGAVTGQGKTSYAETIALENARKHKVLFATLEMNDELIRDRMLAKLMRCGLDSVYAARAEKMQEHRDAMDELARLDLMVWHPPVNQRSIEAITKRAERVSAEILIIDYAAMLRGWEPGLKARGIVDYFWEWIDATKTAAVMLCQVKRPEGKFVRRPTIHDYQDTSALEHRATRALVVWRPFAGKPSLDHVVEIVVGKNRFGPQFMTHARWIGETTAVWEMSEEEEANVLCCRRKRKAE